MKNRSLIHVISYFLMLLVNLLSNLVPIGGKTTAEVSALYPSLATPAPYTFSIWGIIYLLLGVFIVSSFGDTYHMYHGNSLEALAWPWFLISCAMNICWLLSWHAENLGLSMIFMLGLLVSLVVINLKLDAFEPISIWDHISVYGFQLYLGWINVATLANAAILLSGTGWKQFSIQSQTWIIAILIIGAIAGIALVLLGHRYFATLAIIWGYVGILVKHLSPTGYGGTYHMIITALIVSLAGMFVFLYLIIPLQSRSEQHIL